MPRNTRFYNIKKTLYMIWMVYMCLSYYMLVYTDKFNYFCYKNFCKLLKIKPQPHEDWLYPVKERVEYGLQHFYFVVVQVIIYYKSDCIHNKENWKYKIITHIMDVDQDNAFYNVTLTNIALSFSRVVKNFLSFKRKRISTNQVIKNIFFKFFKKNIFFKFYTKKNKFNKNFIFKKGRYLNWYWKIK